MIFSSTDPIAWYVLCVQVIRIFLLVAFFFRGEMVDVFISPHLGTFEVYTMMGENYWTEV